MGNFSHPSTVSQLARFQDPTNQRRDFGASISFATSRLTVSPRFFSPARRPRLNRDGTCCSNHVMLSEFSDSLPPRMHGASEKYMQKYAFQKIECFIEGSIYHNMSAYIKKMETIQKQHAFSCSSVVPKF